MRTSALLAVFYLSASLASAQPRARHLYSDFDGPRPEATILTSPFTITGWALNCETGQQPLAVAVAYFSDDGSWITVPIVATWRVTRLDVKTLYQPYCPNLSSPYLGVSINVLEPLPAGHRWIVIVWTDVQETKAIYVPVNVVTLE